MDQQWADGEELDGRPSQTKINCGPFGETSDPVRRTGGDQ